ncbi:hypothetical protein L195_g059634, partial [Trifolium pratense]
MEEAEKQGMENRELRHAQCEMEDGVLLLRKREEKETRFEVEVHQSGMAMGTLCGSN